MIERERIVSDVARLFTGTCIAQAAGLLRAVFLPAVFAPAQLGSWNLMNVLIGYGANVHLGILHGMNKSLPVMKAEARLGDRERLKNTAFWMCLIQAGILSLVLYAISFFVSAAYGSALQAVSVVVLLQQLFCYFSSLLRADHMFASLSNVIISQAVASSILVFALAYVFPDRVFGALLGLALSFAVTVAYFLVFSPYRFPPEISGAMVQHGYREGLPLIVIGLIDMLFLSADRWVVSWAFPGAVMGYYALGIMACNLLGIVPTSIANVLFPRMLEEYGTTRSPSSVGRFLFNPTRAVAIIMAGLVVAAGLFLPAAVRLLLPAYDSAIPLLGILVPGAFFIGISQVAGSYLVAINRQRLMVVVQVAGIVTCLGLNWLFLSEGYGIRGAAVATVCGYSVYGGGYLTLAAWYATGGWRPALAFATELAVIFGGALVALAAAKTVTSDRVGWSGELLTLAFQLVLGMVVLAPMLWLFGRNKGVLAFIWREAAGRLRRAG